MNITTIQTGCIGENCYLVTAERVLYVIDPGADAEEIISRIDTLAGSFDKVEILLTHSHADHIGAVSKVSAKYNAIVRLAPEDKGIYFSPDNAFPPYIPLAENLPDPEPYAPCGNYTVIPTPGHTPGGVCILFTSDDNTRHLFTGDTLFAGSIGRTDFDGGSMTQLSASLAKLVNTLPEDTVIYPGHGEFSTIGNEKKHNPYL